MEIEKHSSLPTCTNKETASPSTEVKSRDPAQEQGSSKGHKGKRVSLHCHNGQTQTGGSGRSLGAKLSTGQTGGHLPAARLFVMPRTRNSFPVSQARCGDATRADKALGAAGRKPHRQPGSNSGAQVHRHIHFSSWLVIFTT